MNNIQKILLFLIIATVLFTLVEVTLRPLSAWDAWSHWYLGAKAYFIDGYINPTYISYANVSNPPFINLFLTYFFLWMGKVDDYITLFIFFLFYGSLLLAFYFSLKDRTNTTVALLLTFLLASTQNIIRHAGRYDVGNADLPLAYFFFATGILLLRFLETRSKKYLFLLSFLLELGR